MFSKKHKDKELDITTLNDILHTGKKLINIGFFMAIICLILLATFLIQEWNILKYLGELISIISPIFIGLIIAWLFDPIVKYLTSKKIPRVLACIIVYLIMLAFLALLGYILIPSLVLQITDFVGGVPKIIDEIKTFSDGFFSNSMLNNMVDLKEQAYLAIEATSTELTTDLPTKLFAIGKSIVSGGASIILGLMVGFYVLYDFDKINDNITNLLPKSWKKDYKDLCGRINSSLRNYVQGVIIVMFLVFVTQSVGLTIAGLDAPLIFAAFCALTDIIPYFGPYIGGIPAVVVGFTISPIVGICVLISIVVVQLLENNFYQPLIMGHTMKLHPVTIMVGLLVFGHFFGILGMIMATPVIACLKVILEFVNEKVSIKEIVKGEE